MASDKRKPNRLINEKSPYLLQHAYNPVDWYPWGQDAFEKAKKEKKMIFLSVGYSTCHWCHVMERESFESPEIGQLMNEHFVNIKVDREERPDVDKMYMTFIQALAGGGGWPMSVFLTPELQPITGGTYFPPQDQWGRPGFPSILRYVAAQWEEKSDDVRNQGLMLTDALESTSKDVGRVTDGALDFKECVEKCFLQISKGFEPRFGGFHKEPKFPQPVNLDFLLRYYQTDPKSESGKKALDMVEKTLECMARGGIHDHVAQGFHRYSTDQRWHVPHFEKMLYDQAQLAVNYSEAYQITKKPLYEQTVRDILEYVDRDLSHPAGGFFSAEDADSLPTSEAEHKQEGAFCVWTNEEIRELLTDKISDKSDKTLADLFCRHYTVRPGGNLAPHADPHGELTNQNVLISFNSVADTGKEFDLTAEETEEALARCRQMLFVARLMRPKPHLDTKMVTAWNGLMISGYARAAATLGDPHYLERGRKAAGFVQKYLTGGDKGSLLRSAYADDPKSGEVNQTDRPICGFADDYAFLISGLLDLYEAGAGDCRLLEWAEDLQKKMDELFWDGKADCAYFLSPADDPSILVRIKDDQDGAEPSANSVAPLNLIRLGDILGEKKYREKAERIVRGFAERMQKIPMVMPKMVCAVHWLTNPSTQIVICGPKSSAETQSLLRAANSVFEPEKVLILLDGESDGFLRSRAEHLRELRMVDDKATAFVCRDFACSLPVHTGEELVKVLRKES